MKKIIITLAFCLSIVGLHAQNPVQFGLKADLNSSFYQTSGTCPITDNKAGYGLNAGIFLKKNYGQHFAMQYELLFQDRNTSTTVAGVSKKMKSLNIEVPVYFLAQWNVGSGRLYTGAGPYGDYNFSCKRDGQDLL